MGDVASDDVERPCCLSVRNAINVRDGKLKKNRNDVLSCLQKKHFKESDQRKMAFKTYRGGYNPYHSVI